MMGSKKTCWSCTEFLKRRLVRIPKAMRAATPWGFNYSRWEAPKLHAAFILKGTGRFSCLILRSLYFRLLRKRKLRSPRKAIQPGKKRKRNFTVTTNRIENLRNTDLGKTRMNRMTLPK